MVGTAPNDALQALFEQGLKHYATRQASGSQRTPEPSPAPSPARSPWYVHALDANCTSPAQALIAACCCGAGRRAHTLVRVGPRHLHLGELAALAAEQFGEPALAARYRALVLHRTQNIEQTDK